jgi:hypothetical protein
MRQDHDVWEVRVVDGTTSSLGQLLDVDASDGSGGDQPLDLRGALEDRVSLLVRYGASPSYVDVSRGFVHS